MDEMDLAHDIPGQLVFCFPQKLPVFDQGYLPYARTTLVLETGHKTQWLAGNRMDKGIGVNIGAGYVIVL